MFYTLSKIINLPMSCSSRSTGKRTAIWGMYMFIRFWSLSFFILCNFLCIRGAGTWKEKICKNLGWRNWLDWRNRWREDWAVFRNLRLVSVINFWFYCVFSDEIFLLLIHADQIWYCCSMLCIFQDDIRLKEMSDLKKKASTHAWTFLLFLYYWWVLYILLLHSMNGRNECMHVYSKGLWWVLAA